MNMNQMQLGYVWLGKLTVAILLSLLWSNALALSQEPDRSPVDLVLSQDESWLATANQTSNSVSLIRVADGTLLDEMTIGHRPAAIALHPDGDQILVTSGYSGQLHWLRVANERLQPIATIPLGFQPNGVAIAPDGQTAYVALTDADQVAVVNLADRKVTDRIEVGRWPRYLALSQNGTRLSDQELEDLVEYLKAL